MMMKVASSSTVPPRLVVGLICGVVLISSCGQRVAAQPLLNCVEVIQNGGFESGNFGPWTTETDPDMDCEIGLNDGSTAPFPFIPSVFTSAYDPIDGKWDVFTQQMNPGMCKMTQVVNDLPGNIVEATLHWRDRIFSYGPFVDPGTEARVRVCLGDHHSADVHEIWSTDPGDMGLQPGPNDRTYDVTSELQGMTSVDIIFEQQEDFNFFNMYWDQISLVVCTDDMSFGGGPPGVVGDPHFRTWHGQWYDFHGLCDLVLVSNPNFANGLGLDIHVRARARYEYSFLSEVAIRIGDDVFEIGSWHDYSFNGVGRFMPEEMAGQFPVTHTVENKKKERFVIQTGGEEGGEAIVVSVFKDMVSVTFENATVANFGSSVGLMGNYMDGSLRGRDGTVLEDFNLLGQDWQVRESDPQLFLSPTDRPFGSCSPPTAVGKQRRLGETVISREAAEEACGHYKDEQQRSMCIFDVIAMEDLEVAEAHGAF